MKRFLFLIINSGIAGMQNFLQLFVLNSPSETSTLEAQHGYLQVYLNRFNGDPQKRAAIIGANENS